MFTYPKGPFGLRRRKATDTTSITNSSGFRGRAVADLTRADVRELFEEMKVKRGKTTAGGGHASTTRADPAQNAPAALSHPPGVPDDRNRPQCDIAHQSYLGHIPSVDERFCNDRKLAPA
jgi:hypothetical protein